MSAFLQPDEQAMRKSCETLKSIFVKGSFKLLAKIRKLIRLGVGQCKSQTTIGLLKISQGY